MPRSEQTANQTVLNLSDHLVYFSASSKFKISCFRLSALSELAVQNNENGSIRKSLELLSFVMSRASAYIVFLPNKLFFGGDVFSLWKSRFLSRFTPRYFTNGFHKQWWMTSLPLTVVYREQIRGGGGG